MQTVGTERPEITPRQDVEEIKRRAVWKGETGETGEVRGGEERRSVSGGKVSRGGGGPCERELIKVTFVGDA